MTRQADPLMVPHRMRFAHLADSPRLKRLLAVMLDGKPRSPFEINADACCVYNPSVRELEANGIVILSESVKGARWHRYSIPPESLDAARRALRECSTLPEEVGEPVPAAQGSLF